MKQFTSLTLMAVAAVALLVFSCRQEDEDPLVEQLLEQRDSLLQAANGKDTAIHQLTLAMAEIDTNLAKITKKESSLLAHVRQPGDLVADKREEINQNIKEINELMASNARRIKSLTAQLKLVKYHNVALSRMVDLLLEHVMYKNNDLAELNRELRRKNKSIVALNDFAGEKLQVLEQQQQGLAQKDLELNTVYYVLGSSKELKRMCVVDQNNALMGGFNKSYFKQLDLRKEGFIPGNRQSASEIVRLLTPHPASSYELILNDQGKAVNIKIKNQQDFWSRSKYLVVQTK